MFSENWWFQTKRFTGLLELIQVYKQNPLEKFLIFTIYQNYTLALNTLKLIIFQWNLSVIARTETKFVLLSTLIVYVCSGQEITTSGVLWNCFALLLNWASEIDNHLPQYLIILPKVAWNMD